MSCSEMKAFTLSGVYGRMPGPEKADDMDSLDLLVDRINDSWDCLPWQSSGPCVSKVYYDLTQIVFPNMKKAHIQRLEFDCWYIDQEIE